MVNIFLLIVFIYIFVLILYRHHNKKIGYIQSVIGYITLDGVDSSTVKTLKLFTDRIAVIDNFSEVRSIPINNVVNASGGYSFKIEIEFLDKENTLKKLWFIPYKKKSTDFNDCLYMANNINNLLRNKEQQTINSNNTNDLAEKLRWKNEDNTENNSQSKEVDIFINTNEEFQNIRQEVLSKKVWCIYELGTLYSKIDTPSYFVFVDGFLYQITQHSDGIRMYTFRKEDVEIRDSRGYKDVLILKKSIFDEFVIDEGLKLKIEDYYKSLSRTYEHLFVEEVDNIINRLLSNPENKLLLKNFLSIYGESIFEDIPYVNHLEEIVLSSLFCRERNDKGYTGRFYVNGPYHKLIELFKNKNLFEVHNVFLNHQVFKSRNMETYYEYFLTRCLKSLAIDYFSNSFEKMYGNYFENSSNLSINDCIKNYFDIETLEHSRKDSVSRFVYYLYKNNPNIPNLSSNSIYDIYCVINEKITDFKKNKQLNNFERELMKHNSIQEVSENESDKVTINDVDLFSGIEFENFIAYLFKKMGYKVTLTKASGDQGIDVIAEKNGLRLGVQAKCYSSKVSNTAVQEVVAGINHYNLSKGLVVTNNYFTQSARELAKTNNVLLWDREILNEKIKDTLNENSTK